jgi:protein-arginine kinase activator protein McsA
MQKENIQSENNGSAIVEDTLRMCENCQTSFGAPVRENAEFRVYRCPKCKREYKQFNGF